MEDWIVWNGSTPYHTSSKSVKFQMQQSDMHDFSSLHEMMDKLKIKFPRSHPRNSGVSEEEEDNDANSYQHFKEKINWEEDDRIRDVGGEQEDEEWKDDSEVDEGEDQKQYSYETSIDGNDYIDENEVLPLNKFRQSVEMSTMQLDDKISSSISSQHLPSFDSATTSPSSSPSVSQTPNDHDNSPRQAQEPDTLELLCERFQCEGDSVCVSDNEGGVVCLCPLGRGGDHCEKC